MRRIGLRGEYSWAQFLVLSGVCFFVLYLFIPIYVGLAQHFPPSSASFSYVNVVPKEFWILITFLISLEGAFVEELYFRGVIKFLLGNERIDITHQATYICVSALLFSVNRWAQGNLKLAMSLCFGIVTAFIYLKRASCKSCDNL